MDKKSFERALAIENWETVREKMEYEERVMIF